MDNDLFFSKLKDRYPKKVFKAEKVIKEIKNGSNIFIGTATGEPKHLIDALVNKSEAKDCYIYQILPWTLSKYLNSHEFLLRFLIKAFFISRDIRKAALEGKIDYVPAYLSEIPELFSRKLIDLDVALVQVSPPDKYGYLSLGISVDITKSAVKNAKMVIAQVNPKMPKTWGNSFVHVDEIDYLVPFQEPLIRILPRKPDKVVERIGLYVSRLIEDGATIQIGFGQTPNAVLKFLDGKKDLGVHTQMFSQGFIDLIKKGVITNEKKSLHPGKVITSLCMGSESVYRFVHNNPMIEFHPSEYVNDPYIIAQNEKMISINTALEIDLTGQVCADSIGYSFYSGMGDQIDFIRGAARSKGGFPIIALPSTAMNGKISRIVSHLTEGAGVSNTRGDIHYVVTEYGIAHLYGRDIYQRVLELIQVAHPKFRKELLEKAKKHHYIFPDQIPPSEEDLFYLEKYHFEMLLPNGITVYFRPIRSSDEFGCRNFFYALQEKSIYYRFFQNIKEWPHPRAQKWTNIKYGEEMAIVGVIRKEGYEEVIAIGRYAKETDKQAMIAFIVREDFQGMGITTKMLEILEKIALEYGYERFSASVLEDNRVMIHILKKRYPHIKIVREGGGVLMLYMDLKNY